MKDHEDLASMLKSHKGTFALSSKYGNMIEEKDKKGNVTKYEYDNNGNVTKVIDALGHEKIYIYMIN